MALTEEQIKNLKPGDIVREVEWHAVEPSGVGNIYEVEANDGTVIMLRNNPCNIALAPCFLELVYSTDKESTLNAEHEIPKDSSDEFLVCSADKGNTGSVKHKGPEDSTKKQFKVIEGNTTTFSHKIEETCTRTTIVIFPYHDWPYHTELTKKNIALKRANDYCNYLNNVYDSK